MAQNPMNLGPINLGQTGPAPIAMPPVGPQIAQNPTPAPAAPVQQQAPVAQAPQSAPVSPFTMGNLNMFGTGPSPLNMGQETNEPDVMAGTSIPKFSKGTVAGLRKSGATDDAIVKMLYTTSPDFKDRADALVPFFQKQNPEWVKQNSPTWLLNAVYNKGEGNKLPNPELQAVMDYVTKQHTDAMNNSFPVRALEVAVSPVSFADDVGTRLGEYMFDKTTVPPEELKKKMTKDLQDLGTLTQIIGLVLGPELMAGQAATKMPMIGAALEKMGGTFIGKTVLRAIGGALGNIAGKAPQDIVDASQGKDINVLGQAGEGALLTAGPDIAFAAMRKALMPFAPYVTKAMEDLMVIMKKKGVPVNAAGIMQESPLYGEMSGMGKKILGDFGGTVAPEGAAIPGLQKIGSEVIGDTTAVTDDLVRNQGLASKMKESFTSAETAHKAKSTELFGARNTELDNLLSQAETAGSVPSSSLAEGVNQTKAVDVTGASKILQDNAEQLSDLKRQLGIDFGLGKADKANRTLNNISAFASDAQKLTQAKQLQNSLEAINSAIRQASGFGEGAAKNTNISVLKALGGELSDALDTFYQQFPSLKGMQEAASSYYKEAAPAFTAGSPIVDAINAAGNNPSTIPSKFIEAFKGGRADQVARQFEILGPDVQEGIQKQLLRNIIGGGTDTLTGKMTAQSLQKGFDEFGEATLKRILNPDQLAALNQLKKIAQVTENSSKKITHGILSPDTVSYVLRGMTVDLIPSVAKFLVKSVAGKEVAQTMMTNYLTKGITLGMSQATWDVLQSAITAGLRANSAAKSSQHGEGPQAQAEKPLPSTKGVDDGGFNDYVSRTGAKISQYFNGTYDQAHGISFADGRKDHGGYDLAIQGGTAWKPYRGGKIISMGPDGGLGNTVKIRDANGNTYVYGHFGALNSDLKVGQEVTPDTPIGQVGSTGNSTGDHVHFEIRGPNGQLIDPAVTKLT